MLHVSLISWPMEGIFNIKINIFLLLFLKSHVFDRKIPFKKTIDYEIRQLHAQIVALRYQRQMLLAILRLRKQFLNFQLNVSTVQMSIRANHWSIMSFMNAMNVLQIASTHESVVNGEDPFMKVLFE